MPPRFGRIIQAEARRFNAKIDNKCPQSEDEKQVIGDNESGVEIPDDFDMVDFDIVRSFLRNGD